MNSEDEMIVLKNSIGSRLLLLTFLLPIIVGGCFMVATEFTTRPFASVLVGVAQIGLIAVALSSGWSSISYDSVKVNAHIPFVHRKSVAWADVTAYRIGRMNHELVNEGRTVLRIPALRPRIQRFWDECERRGIVRETT
jgi:multidrug efflux pump subunit AcrA (membrane-fusion protein)